jgi:hypothetical protein
MARYLYAFAFWLVLSATAGAACTPQALADLQARGASAAMIAQMCGNGPAGSQQASVCVTKFGVCPFKGGMNAACTCSGQLGAFPGTSR